ncbi:MAG TPA: hydrolase [Acidimicrobiaceae bacterium]|nr:hydrolase [Acidimicrobiaceae bacterium]HAQ22659.1 hydrolase [Acidimicrobiaceae bacterium]HCV34671.1 hydrolase [Acidimicrobiaceae bacterium]
MNPLITVYPARRIHTMDPSLPEANAIAVRGDRIVEVGTLESLRPWLDAHEHHVDDQFAEAVILPGLIDPHVHPSMMAMLMATEWITPEAWDLPGREIPATVGRDSYLARLAEIEDAHPSGRPLVSFGWHRQFHGEVVRADLDALSTARPILVWGRSFHEICCNVAGLELVEAAEGAAWDPHIDLETGRMWESGMAWALQRLRPLLLDEGRYEVLMEEVAQMVHRGGVTTIADAGFGGMALPDRELEVLAKVHEGDQVPFRQYLIPQVATFKRVYGAEAEDRIAGLPEHSSERIRFLRAGKFFADGAFIAQLMQLGEPGYIDGHEGAWMAEPDRLVQQLRPTWEAGRQVNVHVNGDLGVDATLDAIAQLIAETPRFDHRTVLHHFGVSTQAQSRRAAALGCAVQANGYYLRFFGDQFAAEGLGSERASQMTRVGSARRNGMSVALHSDLPMGPLEPLLAASVMATRLSQSGVVLGEHERLSPYDAIAAVTIEPAWQLFLDHEIGSLAAGKLADATVIDGDPFAMDPAHWPDIGIEATMLSGRVYPISQ